MEVSSSWSSEQILRTYRLILFLFSETNNREHQPTARIMGNAVVEGVIVGGMTGGATAGVVGGIVSEKYTISAVAEGVLVGGGAGGVALALKEALLTDETDEGEL